MAYGYPRGFVIEYVSPGQKTPKNDKQSWRECVYSTIDDEEEEENSCKKRGFVFREDGYGVCKSCPDFMTYSQYEEALKKKEEQDKIEKPEEVSIEQDTEIIEDTIIETEPKKKPVIDKYISSRIKIKLNKKDVLNKPISLCKDICESNNIIIWEEKGEKNTCDCGEVLKFVEDNDVIFHIKNEPVYIKVPGKSCKNCGKVYVVKNILINTIEEIE